MDDGSRVGELSWRVEARGGPSKLRLPHASRCSKGGHDAAEIWRIYPSGVALNHSTSKSPAAISTHAPAIENGEGWGNQCHERPDKSQTDC